MNFRQFLNKLLPGLVLSLMTTIPAWAQTTPSTFTELQSRTSFKKGETIEITDENGNPLKARIAALTAQTLTISVKGQKRDLAESQVLQIRRDKPDSLKNGMILGMAVGFAATFVASSSGCTNDPECSAAVFGALVGPFIGGGLAIGALLDSSIHAKETVFSRRPAEKHVSLQAAPLLGKQTKGMKLAFRF
jgi:hypothetical protein